MRVVVTAGAGVYRHLHGLQTTTCAPVGGTAGDGLRCNAGTGRPTAVSARHRLVAAPAERPDKPRFLPPRAGGLRGVRLDCTAARQALGCHTRVDLVDGLARTVAGIQDSATAPSIRQAEGS